MSKLEKKRQALEKVEENAVEGEVSSLGGVVSPLNAAPEHIPDDVWRLIQENGRLATEKLNEILHSPRFHRYSPQAQAKLIDLAQSRAYGRPDPGVKRQVKATVLLTDATAAALTSQAARSLLPEYRRNTSNDSARHTPQAHNAENRPTMAAEKSNGYPKE